MELLFPFTRHTETISAALLVEIAREVVKTVKLFKVRYVGMRGYAHDAKWRIHQIGEIAGAIKAYLWIVHQIAPEIVSPTVAVRHVMGSRGQFTQPEVQEMVETGLGVEVKNMLEVDATVVARYMFDKVVAEEKEIEV